MLEQSRVQSKFILLCNRFYDSCVFHEHGGAYF